MKITILCENAVGKKGASNCLAEWGFSAYIQSDKTNILFDTGHTDVYWKNAVSMGIDLEQSDFVILSHYHWDHIGGLKYHKFNNKKKLITHPDVLNKLPATESNKIINDFEVQTSKTTIEFAKNVFYLGEIPRANDIESGYKNDSMPDDSAIAIKTSNGTAIITGCSHSGICNICEYAKKITGQNIYAVLGGFHLFEENKDAVEQTIEYFKKESPKHLYPMHCIDFPTQIKFHQYLNTIKYSSGDTIEI